MEAPVLSAAQMRAAEESAFVAGSSAEELMEQAGLGIARAVETFFPQPGRCIVFAGKGNNAGDAFVAARWLQRARWRIELRLSFREDEVGDLARGKLRELNQCAAKSGDRTSRESSTTIVLDGLLGIGAKLPLRAPVREACREINRLRSEHGAYVFAIDIPSGLDADSGEADPDCVVADFTIAIGYAKTGLVADKALRHVGRLFLVALPQLATGLVGGDCVLASNEALRLLLPRRDFGAYKNRFSRIGIVAGSKGFTGAAVLCSLGALRAGAGLVRLYVPEEIYPIVAATAPAEAMVKPISSYSDLGREDVEIWAIGPGLGKDSADKVRGFIAATKQPMVIDADALNIIAGQLDILSHPGGARLLTPHPGEMKRLQPNVTGTRAEIARKFTSEFPVTLLLKGSRTIVAEKGRPISFNTTGNPGMATGGMGDVLTGVCAGLIGQGLSTYDAARLGSWVCGRAAEIAIFGGNASEQSLLPRNVLAHLGLAFRELNAGA